MANCRQCQAEITFKPHPNNPDKLAPYDFENGVIGDIHFATCGKPETDVALELDLIASAGNFKFKIGKSGGTTAEHTFLFRDGLFPEARIGRMKDGFYVKIIGEFEANEFISAITLAGERMKVDPNAWTSLVTSADIV